MPRILIIEDNELNRDMLARRLAKHGYEIEVAIDGEEGLARISISPPDLVLMDLSLPGVDGWEATRRLKAAPSTRNLPVIILTAHALVHEQERALATGCDDFDVKPVDLPRLLAKIRRALESRPPAAAGDD